MKGAIPGASISAPAPLVAGATTALGFPTVLVPFNIPFALHGVKRG